jgi:hypothetical protein
MSWRVQSLIRLMFLWAVKVLNMMTSLIKFTLLVTVCGLWFLTSLSTIFHLYRGGVLLVEETGGPGENRRPVASH